ncbi:MAG: spore photoproduct lyase [Thermoanaerobacteraceae bacterium]|nr:spore photoproduct lyase [Thermoanaerobacteraceae bacterium]
MPTFIPRLVLMQRAALNYPLGQHLMRRFNQEGIEVVFYDRRIPSFPHRSFRAGFLFSKRTMVVTLWKRGVFQTCRPSAHYQLPLVSGCPGLCEYCYLNTNLGRRPFVKVYVNLEDIFHQARQYVRQRRPQTTIFEGAATSDPVAVEGWTGSLKNAVQFFAGLKDAYFRFVTKYTDVEGLLGIEHRGKTEIRFSLNSDYIVETFEKAAPRIDSRLKAARKVWEAGYPLGFLIGPIFAFEGWRREYERLLAAIRDYLPEDATFTFELITHRFTSRAKKIIQEAYPGTEVPMDERERRFRYGQFGYGKYVYPPEVMEELQEFFYARIEELFPHARILYFV